MRDHSWIEPAEAARRVGIASLTLCLILFALPLFFASGLGRDPVTTSIRLESVVGGSPGVCGAEVPWSEWDGARGNAQFDVTSSVPANLTRWRLLHAKTRTSAGSRVVAQRSDAEGWLVSGQSPSTWFSLGTILVEESELLAVEVEITPVELGREVEAMLRVSGQYHSDVGEGVSVGRYLARLFGLLGILISGGGLAALLFTKNRGPESSQARDDRRE